MIIPQDQFIAAFKKLPYSIRDYITTDELAAITEEIGTKHNLHVDIIGALYREVTNMLLGFENPQQFMAELKNIGVPQANVQEIVHELNEKVFVPLREKMKDGGEHDPYKEDAEIEKELYENAETKNPILSVGSRSISTAAPAPVPSVPALQVSGPAVLKMKPFVPPTGTPPFPNPVPPMPASQAATGMQMPAPPQVQVQPMPQPVSVPVPVQNSPSSYIRTMSEDIQAVQHHQVPQMHQFSHINQAPVAQMPAHMQALQPSAPVPQPLPQQIPQPVSVPTPIYSAQTPQMSQPQYIPTSQPNLAYTVQAPAMPQQAPQTYARPLLNQQPIRTFPAPIRLDTHENIERDYTHDPYREPIDDK